MLCYVDGSHKEYKALYTSWGNREQVSDFVHNVSFTYGEQDPWWPQTHCHLPMLELQVSTTIPRHSVFPFWIPRTLRSSQMVAGNQKSETNTWMNHQALPYTLGPLLSV